MVDGTTLLEQTLLDHCREDDRAAGVSVALGGPADWDSSLAEFSLVTKTRIPQIVEERCRGARHRINCGLFAEIHHAWASSDALLHIWDYQSDCPEVLLVPADSAIVSVALCPPRPGVFESTVHQVLVLCTRFTVSLVGLHLSSLPAGHPYGSSSAAAFLGGGVPTGSASLDRMPWAREPAGSLVPTGQVVNGNQAALPFSGPGGFFVPGTMQQSAPLASSDASKGYGRGYILQRLVLEGYVARTDGALFHCIRHTLDGHILLVSGAPHVYELAYSRTPGWFHSKCRLIRHTTGFRSWVRDFVPLASRPAASSRIRLLATAPYNYALAADGSNTLRLLGLRDQPVTVLAEANESVAMLEELAVIKIEELSDQLHALTQRHLASQVITHLSLETGLDGHVRAHVVTSAGERILCICSASSASGPERSGFVTSRSGTPAGAQDQGTASQQKPQRLRPWPYYYGFWLQRVSEGRGMGHGAHIGGTQSNLGGWLPSRSSPSTGPATGRQSCLEEVAKEPCLYANGVWLYAAGGQHLGVTARAEDLIRDTVRQLHTSLAFDAEVIDIAEEAEESDRQEAFWATRSYAILLQSSVQIFRLSFKPPSLTRPPSTPAECFLYFTQLALLPGAVLATQTPAVQLGTARGCGSTAQWSFDDVGIPSFDEQRQHMEAQRLPGPANQAAPSLHLGRWLTGFLRFLAVVLRPVWLTPLVRIPLRGQVGTNVAKAAFRKPQDEPGLRLSFQAEKIRCLLARLRPALRFARLAATARTVSSTSRHCPSAAARSRLYTQERTVASESEAQAKRILRGVLETADRMQEVLGLVSVLQAHRSAYRVLHSSVISEAALDSLISKPLGSLVLSFDMLEPVVQLCAALVVESGLTTPAPELIFKRPSATAGGSCGRIAGNDVCHELDAQCPSILARVDLNFVRMRLGAAGCAPGTGSAGELLRRCVQCVSSTGSLDGHWENLAHCVQAMAAEDPRGAIDTCVEKLQHLQQVSADAGNGGGQSAARARLLLQALLGAICAEPGSSAKVDPTRSTHALVEHLLVKTSLLRFQEGGADASVGAAQGNRPVAVQSASVCFAHSVIFDHLLGTPQLHRVLKSLLERQSFVVDLEAFLRSRCYTDKNAGNMLWKHFLRQGRHSCAGEVLARLAEWPDLACTLLERVRFLDQARQAMGQALPESKEVFEKLGAQLDVAMRVQVPLQHELQLICDDERLAPRWRSLAERRCQELRQLLGLQVLYEIAVDFGMFHVVLIIVDLSSSVQQRESLSKTWISVFFPPADVSPYSAACGLTSECAARPHGLFPLLMVRRSEAFFARSDCLVRLPTAMATRPEDLRLRATRLLDELVAITQAPSALWNVRSIATLLEYCNCLWHKALENSTTGSAKSKLAERPIAEVDTPLILGDSAAESELAWVALEVLPRRPFHFARKTLLQFYAETLATVPAWFPDLEALLPTDTSRSRPVLTEEDVYLHLGEVIVVVLGQWLSPGDAGCAARVARRGRPPEPSSLGSPEPLDPAILESEHLILELLASLKRHVKTLPEKPAEEAASTSLRGTSLRGRSNVGRLAQAAKADRRKRELLRNLQHLEGKVSKRLREDARPQPTASLAAVASSLLPTAAPGEVSSSAGRGCESQSRAGVEAGECESGREEGAPAARRLRREAEGALPSPEHNPLDGPPRGSVRLRDGGRESAAPGGGFFKALARPAPASED